MKHDTPAFALSILTGSLLWIATAQLAHTREPWDSDLYWTAAYPSAVLLSGLLAIAFPQRPWRWALCLMFSQLAVMLATGSGLGLLPMGLVLLAILAIPAIGMALLAGRLRLRPSS